VKGIEHHPFTPAAWCGAGHAEAWFVLTDLPPDLRARKNLPQKP
jgi:hypothetical protein